MLIKHIALLHCMSACKSLPPFADVKLFLGQTIKVTFTQASTHDGWKGHHGERHGQKQSSGVCTVL